MEVTLKFDYRNWMDKPWGVGATWTNPRNGKVLSTESFGESATIAATDAIQHLMLAIACDNVEDLHND